MDTTKFHFDMSGEEKAIPSTEDLVHLVALLQEDASARPQSLSHLQSVASSGKCPYEWSCLRILVFRAFVQAFESYSSRPSHIEGQLVEAWVDKVDKALQSIQGLPWTLQRICEVLVEPQRNYKTCSGFVVGFSKLVCGVRERKSKEGSFGLPISDFPVSEGKPATYQLPFYNAPKLRSTLLEDVPKSSPPNIDAKDIGLGSVANDVAHGVATVFPKQ